VTARLFLVAGEVSGDIYGADLAAALRRLRPDLELVGIGGARMSAAGVRCLADSTQWGVIGWAEALPRVPLFLPRLNRVLRAVARQAPAAVVLIDFPGFNLPLARRLSGRVPLLYFIPPMVSTRKGGRAQRIARINLRLLTVLPFETAAYRDAGADVTFVGHPAIDRVRASAPPAELRRRLDLPAAAPVVALLPGSRRLELRRHLPVIVAALAALRRHTPDVRAVLPVAAPQQRPLVERAVRGSAVPITLAAGGGTEGYDALAAADFAIIASGTATVEALCLGVPMVVIYRLSRLTYRMARRIAAVSWAALPSLLAGRAVVPELLQDALTPERLAAVVAGALSDPAAREAQRRDLLSLRPRLGAPGAADRAAQEVLRGARLLGSSASSTIQTN
jgi:lipid-A-disaccharide synthase